MPGYVIHLAVGKVYLRDNKVEDLKEFERGIIAPDLAQDKSKSHYGPYSSKPDLNRYIELNGKLDDFKEGYFLHLLTDHLFYNKFLPSWSNDIYDDYNKLNMTLIKRYGIIVPKEVQDIVQYEDGNPKILNENELYCFIEAVGKINIREMFLSKDVDLDEELSIDF